MVQLYMNKKILGSDIKTVEYGWPIGMPVSRSLENGFIKKTQKTPQNEIDLALKRAKGIK